MKFRVSGRTLQIAVLLFMICLFVLAYIFTSPAVSGWSAGSEAYSGILQGWTVSKTGDPVTVKEIEFHLQPDENGRVVIRKTLSQHYHQGECLSFATGAALVTVTLNGKTIYSYQNPGNDYLKAPIFLGFHRVTLSDAVPGDLIEITVETVSPGPIILSCLAAGSQGEMEYLILSMLGDEIRLCTMILLMAVILGAVVLLIFSAFPDSRVAIGYYGMSLLLLAVLCIASDSGIIAFFFGMNPLAYFVGEIAFMLVPLFVVFVLIYFEETEKCSRFLWTVRLISLVLPILSILKWIFLHRSMGEEEVLYDLFPLVISVAPIRYLFVLRGRERIRHFALGIGSLCYAILSLVGIVLRILNGGFSFSFLYSLGILFFMLGASLQFILNLFADTREREEEKRREAKVREHEREIALVIGDSPRTALLTDPSFRSFTALRYPRREEGLIRPGMTYSEYLHATAKHYAADSAVEETLNSLASPDRLRPLLEKNEPIEFLLTRTSGGHKAYGKWRVQRLPSDSRMIVVYETDVTQEMEAERLRNEAEIEKRSNAAKTQFLANVSHEIRTPINAILGYAELIITSDETTPGVREDIEGLMSAGNTLLELVNDLLDMTRVESGNLSVNSEPYSLEKLKNALENSVRPRIQKKDIEFYAEIKEGTPLWMIGDLTLLRQIGMNLLSNAAKYTEKGEIRFSFDYDGTNLILTVSDSGVGIDEKDLEKIFSKFERLGQNKHHQIEGAGIGLTLVKEIVETMNGEIRVASELGRGTTFTVFLPQAVSEPIEEENSHPVENFVADQAKILLVDDNEVNLHVMERLLRSFEVSVDAVKSGPEAIEHLYSTKYDLIFLDHMMPGLDGVETLKRIRRLRKIGALPREEIPIVALTANAIPGMREFFLENGFSDFAPKPVRRSVFSELLQKWLPFDLLSEVKSVREEGTEALPAPLSEAKWLDAESAVESTGGVQNLFRAIEIFLSLLEERLLQLEALLKEGDIASYRIEVHALKGSSRMIGALEMAEQAAYLEECAASGKSEELSYFTKDFLILARHYGGELEALLKACREN